MKDVNCVGVLKGVMKNRVLGMNVKKVLYEKVVVPSVMYGSESWGMKVTERQKLNVLWKTGEDGLCCSSSAIQTQLGPSSLL